MSQATKIITGNLASGQTAPEPTIECWIPDLPHLGIGLIIFPGGGYHHLAEHEGRGYPVITFCDVRPPRRSSFLQLAGEKALEKKASETLIEELSCERHVTSRTPPCFIWHGAEDSAVPAEHSLVFASALRKEGVSVELHLYAKGVHGTGLNTPFPWATDCLRWMEQISTK